MFTDKSYKLKRLLKSLQIFVPSTHFLQFDKIKHRENNILKYISVCIIIKHNNYLFTKK